MANDNIFELTPRELEVMHKLVAGHRVADIAESLLITPATVKFHLGNIYYKMNVKDRFQAFVKWNDYYG